MSAQRRTVFIALCLLAASCGGGSEGDTTTPSTTAHAATTEPEVRTGPITTLAALSGTWYLSGLTSSAMHFNTEGEWWWAKSGLALELKMEREPDGHVAFENGLLVFVDDTVCNDEEHGYTVNLSADEGIEFVGDDACLRRSLWLSPPAGDTTWNLVDDE